MRDVEAKISPLIAGMFPSFYQEDGPNFIAFVQAYYEWLEQNFQLIDLESIENFNVGDTVTQDKVTGTIYSIVENSILVLVDGLETFKCFNVCSELIPVTSSSGGFTYILRGGTSRRMGSIFLGRNLPNIRDIDRTVDLFIVKFKEKYLKNIEFDTQTNKRLLVKNSLDLYRSKGTSRSIDLFFRLIYGEKSEVYYPGDDLFRLSDAEWFKPQYIEINPSSVDRAISLVGKQISGVNSGATAFVERYVKKKVKTSFVHLFLVSSVRGDFQVNEAVKYDRIFDDSPTIVGSLTNAVVIDGSESFSVGDLINIDSDLGTSAVGRVSSTIRGDGRVSFKLEDGGWGYTTNLSGTTFEYSANTFLSEKIILLANVESGQFVSSINVVDGGTGYSNDDVIVLSGRYDSATATPSTNSTGGVISIRVSNRGSGFFPAQESTGFTVLDVNNNASAGTDLSIDIQYQYPKKYFEYLEDISQNIYRFLYSSGANTDRLPAGTLITVNGTQTGRIIEHNVADGIMVVTVFNNGVISDGDLIEAVDDAAATVTVFATSVYAVTGKFINANTSGTVELGIPEGTFLPGDVIIQRDAANVVCASAEILRTVDFSLAGGQALVRNISGVFRPDEDVFVVGKTSSAPLKTISFSIAVIDSSNTYVDPFTSTTSTINFSDVGSPFLYSDRSGIQAFAISVSGGVNAQYKIATLSDVESVTICTDGLVNTDIMNTPLNALAFNLPQDPTANLESVIFGALSFADVTLGSVRTLGEINPGVGYTGDPVTSVYQPGVTGYQARDYVFTITGNESQFLIGEYIEQTLPTAFVRVFIDDASVYRRGEFVYAANTTTDFIANGTVTDVNTTNNYVDIQSPTAIFPVGGVNVLKSTSSVAQETINSTVYSVQDVIARGILQGVGGSTLFVKRIQLENKFTVGGTVKGTQTGATATLVEIGKDYGRQIAGFNAAVDADATVANGVISTVQIVDSGYGFFNDTEAAFTAQKDERTGTLSISKGGVGTGAGFYRNNKGFVSDLSKLHDGDYYQEYSYDIISRIPLSKYADMFKKVMHTAGTRFFGSVLIDSVADIPVKLADSVIEVGNSSPYVIQDRDDVDVQDRGDFYIEIREF